MRRWVLGAGLALGLAAGGADAAPMVAKPVANPSCDEACLSSMVDRYLAGQIGHLSNHAPLAKTARYTENAVRLPFDRGLWKTLTGVGAYRHIVADPTTGEVALFGIADEGGTPGLQFLRLKVANHEIVEAEALVPRGGVGALGAKEAAPKPVWTATLAPAERSSRAKMAEIANSYFDALIKGNGALAPFDPACVRVENGVQQANDPAAKTPIDPEHPGLVLGSMTCQDQISTGVTRHIQSVEPRRIYAIDEARGVVFGVFMLRVPGDIVEFDAPGIGKVKMPVADIHPFDAEVGMAFKIRNGRIMETEAVSMTLVYGSNTGWE